MPVDVYNLEFHRETIHTGVQVGKIYRKRVLGTMDTTIMLTTKIAYGLQVYETVSQYGTVDFNYYIHANPLLFGVPMEMYLRPAKRLPTTFCASPSLMARLDAVRDVVQEMVQDDQVKIYRNSVIACLFRLVIDYDRDTVHYVEKND